MIEIDNDHQPSHDSVENYGPGNVLRSKREEYEWSIESVADALHLPVSHIDAIENDRYDELPGSTYIIGYWRSYARVLGIDIEATIEANKRNVIEAEFQDVVMPSQEGMHLAGSNSSSMSVLFGLFLLLLLIVGGLWYAWQQGVVNFDSILAEGTPSVSVSEAKQEDVTSNSPLVLQEPVMVAVKKENVIVEEQVLAPSTVAGSLNQPVLSNSKPVVSDVQAKTVFEETSAKKATTLLSDTPTKSSEIKNSLEPELNTAFVAKEASLIKEATKVVVAPEKAVIENVDPGQISLLVEQDSWLDVRDSTLKRLIYRSETGDKTIDLKGEPPFYIYIGTPTGVKVEYLGKNVPFETHKSGLFARFKIGEKRN